MASPVHQLCIVGLGNIGGNLALQALEKGFRVVGHDKREPGCELRDAGLAWVSRLGDLPAQLARPRAMFLYLPAGPVVDTVLDELAGLLERGDVVVDGGNSYWGDSIARHRRMTDQGLGFVDLGTSGGVSGARHGACLMAGGDRDAVALVEPLLTALAVDGGYVHAGPPGSGHFTKLVHNGIEFGMLQAIGEGLDLLEHHGDDLPVAEILRCWAHGSVIRSWLVELMEQQYRMRNGIADIPGYVEDTGEVNWLVDDAMHMEVAVPVIATSVMQLLASRDRNRNWARAIAMMRHGFGNHPFGADPHFAANRATSRVGGFRRRT